MYALITVKCLGLILTLLLLGNYKRRFLPGCSSTHSKHLLKSVPTNIFMCFRELNDNDDYDNNNNAYLYRAQ